MASRDLTRKFVERRSSRPRKVVAAGAGGLGGGRTRGEHSEMLQETSDLEAPPGMVAISLPPAWVDLVDAVEVDVAKIERLSKDAQALYTKRLMVFDDSGEVALDNEINGTTGEVTRLFRSCEKSLKRVRREEAGKDVSSSEATVRGNIQRSMAMKIQGLNANFRQNQREYLRRLKSMKDGTTDSTFDFLSGGGSKPSSSGSAEGDASFNVQQMAAVIDIETLVDERDQEIAKIAQSIQDLSTIFKELAVLVIDQGTILDRIDFNMEQVADHVRKGVVEIEQAEKYQKAARPRICIGVLLLLITVMLIAVILKHRGSGKKD